MPENALVSYQTPEAEVTLFDPQNQLWEKCETGTMDHIPSALGHLIFLDS